MVRTQHTNEWEQDCGKRGGIDSFLDDFESEQELGGISALDK